MFNNALTNFALDHLPKSQWNSFSSLCAALSLPSIGSPIAFSFRSYSCREYPPGTMTQQELDRFIAFCYPRDLPDRQLQIECDRRNYWEHAHTFLVTGRRDEIIGCVQVIHRDRSKYLPVEFGYIQEPDGRHVRLNLSSAYDTNAMTEIYRCRRSFSLTRFESMNVILMLFKAIVAHVIETKSAFSFISFDTSRADLRHLYINKCNFFDTGTDILFDSDTRPWRLLHKDWFNHEQTFATLGKTQFFLQTWCRMGLRHKHLHHQDDIAAYLHDCNLVDSGKLVVAEALTSPGRLNIHRRKKGFLTRKQP